MDSPLLARVTEHVSDLGLFRALDGEGRDAVVAGGR